ncbi:MAG: hypothetical protein RLZZ200_268 [Pseudomonadota bacterium]|jgi:cytochrome c-type biogenesis protein CcmH/NrfG
MPHGRFRLALFILTLLPVVATAAPGKPDGTWRLFKDSDGKVPRSGSTIELTLANGKLSIKAVQPGETVTDTGSYTVNGSSITVEFRTMEQGKRTGPWSVSADTLVLPFPMLTGGQGSSTWMTQAALESFLSKVPSKPSTPETMPALLARVQKVAEAFGNTAQRQAIDQRAKASSAQYKGGEAQALFSIGTVHFINGYYREAWYAFARASVLQPTNAVYLTNLATSLQEIGSQSDARAILEWVTKNYPNLDPPFGSLGTVCLQLKDLACAKSALARGKQLSPGSGLYDFGLAKIAEQEGRTAEAQSLFKSAFDKGYGASAGGR